jgi:YhhN-like protein
LGHVSYLVALLTFANAHGLNAPAPRWIALAIWLLIGAAGWYLVVFRGQKATALHWAALPYALLLASLAGVATGLALQSALFVPLAIGAALFLLSDLILAGELFAGLSFPLIGDVIWLTYGPAQALIVYSVASALRIAGIIA